MLARSIFRALSVSLELILIDLLWLQHPDLQNFLLNVRVWFRTMRWKVFVEDEKQSLHCIFAFLTVILYYQANHLSEDGVDPHAHVHPNITNVHTHGLHISSKVGGLLRKDRIFCITTRLFSEIYTSLLEFETYPTAFTISNSYWNDDNFSYL